MKSFYLIVLFLGCTTICHAQQRLTKEQLHEDANVLYSSILDVHPYMFTNISKEKFEKELEQIKSTLKDSMTAFDFYKMFAPLVAKIEDGHTELDYPVNLAIKHGVKVFPYTFAINKTDTTLIIQKGFEGAKLSPGFSILTINGVSSKELLRQAFTMLSGETYHFKMEKLNILFSPLLHFILPSNEFLVEYLNNGKIETTTIQAKTFSQYMEVLLVPSIRKTPYYFNIDKKLGTAILSINSFDIYDKQGKKEYRNFLDSLFNEISQNHINNLVIDIRMNGGGLEELVWDLFQYISPVPFQTKGPSINKISETVKAVYNMKEQPGIYLLGAEGLIPLRENSLRYSGNTYLLTSNFTFSSASLLAWAFQYFKMGEIIGEETGGLIVSYGNVFNTNLPNTDLSYGISKWKLYGYEASEDHKHGVIPDIIIPSEKAKDAVIEIIKNKNKR